MDLSKIYFHVETKPLKDAVDLVEKLGNAVQALGQDVQVLATADKNASAAALMQAKARKENAQAAKIEAGALQQSAKASDAKATADQKVAVSSKAAASGLGSVDKIIDKFQTKVEILATGGLRLNDSFIDLGRGLTASQAGLLAQIKQLGATETQFTALNAVINDYARITGQNPFDASANGLYRVDKQLKELIMSQDLANKGYGLTRDQVKLLTRDLEALAINYKTAGLGADALKDAEARLTKEFVEKAQSLNTVAAAAKAAEVAQLSEAKAAAERARLEANSGQALFDEWKLRQKEKREAYQTDMQDMRKFYQEQERLQGKGAAATPVQMDAQVQAYYKNQSAAAKDAARATAFLEQEMQRAERALEGLNQDLHVSTTNRLMKFEQQLKASGMEASEARLRLEQYKKTIIETDKIRSQKGHLMNRSEEDKKVAYLARGLAPQISDVLVSLQSGMPVFTVMMQQGMQVRDLMQLSGVEAGRMGEAFKKAGQGMITTTVAAAGAIGQMLLGVIMDTGSAVAGLGMKLPFIAKGVNSLSLSLAILADQGSPAQQVVGRLGLGLMKMIPAALGAAIAATVVGLGALAIALYKVIKQENELNRVMTMNGAAMGLTYDTAYSMAKSYEAVNGSGSKAVTVMQAMAKEGNLSSQSFTMIADAAIAMQRSVGTPVEETVKKFSELAKEPAKVLFEIAKQTGSIDVETLKLVNSLNEAGKKSEAAAVAMRAYANATKDTTQTVMDQYGYLTKFAIDAKAIFSSMWDALLGVGRKGTLQDQIQKAQENVANTAKRLNQNPDDMYAQYQASKASAELADLKKRLKAEQDLGNQRKANADLATIEEKLSGFQSKNRSQYQRDTDELIATEQKLLGMQAKGINVESQLNSIRAVRAELERDYLASLKSKDSAGRGAKDLVDKEAVKALEAYTAFIRDMQAAAITAGTEQQELTKAQSEMITLLGSDNWKNLPEANRQNALSYFYLANSAQIAQEAIAKASASAKESFTKDSKAFDAAIEYEDALKQVVDTLQEESAAIQFQSGLMGLSNDARQKAIEMRKIEIEYQKELNKINQAGEFADKEGMRNAALAARNLKMKNLNDSMVNDLTLQLTEGITDAVMTGLIEGGKAGRKSLRALIVAELQKPIRIFVQAEVSALMGGGQGSQILSALGKIGNLMGMGGGTAGSILSSLGVAGGSLGTAVGSAQSIGLALQNAGASNATINAAMGLRSNTPYGIAGYAAYKGISGGYSIDNSIGKLVDVVGKFAGFFGPGGVVVSAIAGLTNRMFGRKLDATGIQAQISGGQVQGVNQFSREKGGWFRSDKTTTSGIDSATANQVTKDFERIKFQAMGMSNALGLSTGAIEGFNGKLEINYKGAKTAEEQSQRYAEGLNKVYESMMLSAGGLDKFKIAGESTAQTLERLTKQASDLANAAGYSAESVTDTLVKAMTGQMEKADVGATLGDIIVGSVYNALAMGFAEQITSSITGLIIQPLMTSIMMGGNIASVVSQASIDAVVEQARSAINAFNQVLSDPAVQAMFAELNKMTMEIVGMSVTPVHHIQAFGSAMRDAADEAAEAAKKIADQRFSLESKLMQELNRIVELRQREIQEIDESNRHLQEHIWKLQDSREKHDRIVAAAGETLNKLQEAKDKLKGIFDLLITNIRELRDEVDSTANMSRVQAQALIAGALASGQLPDQDKLQIALQALRRGIDQQVFASQVDADRARLILSNDLDNLSEIAGGQLKVVENEFDVLTATLENAEKQLNALLGIETYSFNAVEAIAAVNSSLKEYDANFGKGLQLMVDALKAPPAAVSPGTGGGGGGHIGGHQPPARAWTPEGYAAKNPDLVAEYNNNHKRKGWPKELSSLNAYLSWHWNNQGKNENRQFAKGGAFTNGIVSTPTMFNIGEMGEAGSEAIMPLSNIGGSLGVKAIMPNNDALVAELQALRKEVTFLRAETRAVVTNTQKTFKVLDDATEGGNELRVNVVNTPSVEVVE